jgi:drug/metabolite transporter (DMT)-like permease
VLERLLAPLFVLLWSTGFIGAKYGLPFAGALSFVSVRCALVLGLMLLAAWAFRAPWPRGWRQIAHIAVAGVLMQAAYLNGVFLSGCSPFSPRWPPGSCSVSGSVARNGWA